MCKNTTDFLEITIIILMLTKGIHTTSSKICISPVFKIFHWPLITFRIKITPVRGLAGPACVGSCLPPLIPHFFFHFTPTTLASFLAQTLHLVHHLPEMFFPKFVTRLALSHFPSITSNVTSSDCTHRDYTFDSLP